MFWYPLRRSVRSVSRIIFTTVIYNSFTVSLRRRRFLPPPPSLPPPSLPSPREAREIKDHGSVKIHRDSRIETTLQICDRRWERNSPRYLTFVIIPRNKSPVSGSLPDSEDRERERERGKKQARNSLSFESIHVASTLLPSPRVGRPHLDAYAPRKLIMQRVRGGSRGGCTPPLRWAEREVLC